MDRSGALVGPNAPAGLAGRTFIITGAGNGIGRATALYLASLGCRLALTDLDPEAGKLVCQEIREESPKCDIVFAALDVSDDIAVGKLVRTFAKTYKRIDGLVNCAGVNPITPQAHLTSLADYQTILDVNAKGSFSFCQHFLKDVTTRIAAAEAYNASWTGAGQTGQVAKDGEAPAGGWSIVNMGSTASLTGLADSAAYCASKHAVLGFSRAMAKEYAKQNIRVNVIAPGMIDTQLLQDKLEPTEPTVQEHAEKLVPLNRIGEAHEIATVVAFLLGSDSSYITVRLSFRSLVLERF
ncbi:hypothetical protein RQP46_006264 [Phenoliferia psychrophenolica]